MKWLRSLFVRIPREYKNEYMREIDKSNLFRTMMISLAIAFLCSAVLLFFREAMLVDGEVLVIEILFNVIFLAIAALLYTRFDRYPNVVMRLILNFYILNMFLSSTIISLATNYHETFLSIYTITLFLAAAVIFFPLANIFSLLLISYVFFFFIAGYLQPDIAPVLRVNALVITVLTLVISRFGYRDKIVYFIDKKLIEEKNETLGALAVRDSMTGLFNHETIYYRLEKEIEAAKIRHSTLSVAMMDIDLFKAFNDEFGHQAGDEVIIKLSRILQETCRAKDIIGRYGGEEFFIISPDTELTGMFKLTERIRENVCDTTFFRDETITVSIGISQYQGQNYELLIKQADECMYMAKRNGRNMVWGPDLEDIIKQERQTDESST